MAASVPLHLPVPTLRRALAAATATVAFAGLAAEVPHHTIGAPDALVAFLSLSDEGNLPTWYAAAVLLACSLVLAAIAAGATAARAPFHRRWWLLSAIFAYISLDEVATLHERLNAFFSLPGILHFGWILPAAAAVALLGAAYLPFVQALPPRTRGRVVVAGALYVGGALLMELPLGWWVERGGGAADLGYVLIDWVEEALELAGATLFLTTLLEHLADRHPAVQVTAPDTTEDR